MSALMLLMGSSTDSTTRTVLFTVPQIAGAAFALAAAAGPHSTVGSMLLSGDRTDLELSISGGLGLGSRKALIPDVVRTTGVS